MLIRRTPQSVIVSLVCASTTMRLLSILTFRNPTLLWNVILLRPQSFPRNLSPNWMYLRTSSFLVPCKPFDFTETHPSYLLFSLSKCYFDLCDHRDPGRLKTLINETLFVLVLHQNSTPTVQVLLVNTSLVTHTLLVQPYLSPLRFSASMGPLSPTPDWSHSCYPYLTSPT